MTLSPQLGMSESITLWRFRHPLLILIFTRIVSSPRPVRDWNALTDSIISAAEAAEDSVAKLFLLQGLGNNFTDQRSESELFTGDTRGSGERLPFRHVTSKQV